MDTSITQQEFSSKKPDELSQKLYEEVKAALKTFMNTASQHIMVKREDFEPMLSKAVNKTLVLLLDPSKHFDDYVRDSPDFMFTKDRLAQLAKYTKHTSMGRYTGNSKIIVALAQP